MAEYTLVIGNRATSSWSLRGWLVMKSAGVDFDEVMVWLSRPESKAGILEHSPSGFVPVLKHSGRVIWDSLAIAEYMAENRPDANLWPDDPGDRAHARTISAEMHAGFGAMRNHMFMDLQNDRTGQGRDKDGAVEKDIKRICEIWRDTRDRFGAGGDFLLGDFSIADIMYAPVATRFKTYGVDLDGAAKAYADAILSHPLMLEWTEAAKAEPPPGELP